MAVSGLKRISSLGTPNAEKILTLLLLFVMLTVAVASLASVLASPDWGALWSGLALALLFAWELAVLDLPAGRSGLILSILGIIFALFSAGRVGSKLSIILNEIFVLLRTIFINPQEIRIDLIPIQESTADMFHSIGVILTRVFVWSLAIAKGVPTFDPVAAGFVWIILVWIVAAWASWVTIRNMNALMAVLPAILLSVGALSFAQQESFSLYLMLGLSLILLAIVEQMKREKNWGNAGTAFPPRKWKQVVYSAVIISTGLVLLSAALSSISIPQILEWASTYGNPATPGEGGVAESLGIISNVTTTRDMFEEVRNPGLPQDKLIGSGPELSKRIVMTVKVDDFPTIFKDDIVQPMYWRSFTYDSYTGRGWRTSHTISNQYEANQLIQADRAAHHIQIDQVVRTTKDESQIVFMAGEPVSINHPSEVAWRSPGDVFGILIDGARSIEVRSLFPVVDEITLRSKGQNYPDWVSERYLTLPADLSNRVQSLALQLTAPEPTPYDRVIAIERYLRTIPYTLDVPYPPLDKDLVEYFLFDLHQGYCDYYASAMVVLVRAAGLPARFVTGYASGTYDLKAKRFVVSEAEAHSWVEVYFPEIGWVPFEPTSGRPALDRSGQSRSIADGNLPLSEDDFSISKLDSKSAKWTLWLGLFAAISLLGFGWVGYDEVRLNKLSERDAAKEIFFRLKRYGEFLDVISQPGNTPNEFAELLRSRVQILAEVGLSSEKADNLNGKIESITDGIVETSFRPEIGHSDPKFLLVRQWKGLRHGLFMMWVVNKMTAITGILARGGDNNVSPKPEFREKN